jgi:hydroxymethylpyrimidine pyrophosphatase-like HAD family hydrolase
MFKQTGMSIAMGQAVESVKLYAKYTTDSNDDDGWAHAMMRYVLQRGGTEEQS